MAKQQLNVTKRLQIDKANATMVAMVAAAAFIAVFSLVSSRALLRQRTYQNKVIDQQTKARDQLKTNLAAVDQLVIAYKSFTTTPDNVIGGNPSGTGDKDGDNAKIILDALPSKYDFPALTTSIEKLLGEKKFKVNSITGTDDEVAQSKNESVDNPEPIEIPFEFDAESNSGATKDLINVLEKSIRPIHIKSITLTGGESNLKLRVTAKTYYQPEKSLNIKTQVVKE